MIEANFKKMKRVHFIGLGGIGVSALARMFSSFGALVSGSDNNRNSIIDDLEKAGIIFSGEHREENITSDIEMIVYTIAIDKDNPELKKSKELGIKIFSYPEALGVLSRQMKTVAISGTHGKTTTTAMIAKIAKEAGLNPTVIVGSLLAEEKTNFIAGGDELLIVEACEYRRSFLNLLPSILAITNIDNDHLDYYRDLDDIKDAFREFVSHLNPGDILVCPQGDPNFKNIIENDKIKILDYKKEDLSEIDLLVPGQYNRDNAQTALALARALGIDRQKALDSLKNFKGTWRRFEYKGRTNSGALVYDDYAHHPTEIRSLLSAVREKYPQNRIIAIFQPHLYSRTKFFLKDLADALSLADEVLILPIYASREKEDISISSRHLVDKIPESLFFDDWQLIKEYIEKKTSKDDIIITIGAGDINELSKVLIKN